jgi:hypothetical protein
VPTLEIDLLMVDILDGLLVVLTEFDLDIVFLFDEVDTTTL